METILEIKGLSKEFYLHAQNRLIKSCRDISFALNKVEIPPVKETVDNNQIPEHPPHLL